jgi:ABC-type sugar transport system substrate-binding protein
MKLPKLFAAVALAAVTALTGCSMGPTPAAGGTAAQTDTVKVAIIPKINGIPYYQAVKQGVDEAAKEIGRNVEVIWNGPSTAEASEQVKIIENMINAKVNVIAVAANDPAAVAPALQKAKQAGIRVMSWDGDANERELFVQLVDPNAFGAALADQMADQVGETADVAVVTSTLTAPNQSAWLKGIKARIAEKHPGLKIVTTTESGEDQALALNQTKDILRAYPDVKGIFAITTAALPGAAQAVDSVGMKGKVAVVGNSTPNAIKQYFKSGVLKSAVLWNPIDHGYLTVYSALALSKNQVADGKEFKAGRLGAYTPVKDEVSEKITLSKPLVFTAENIDKYNF